MQVCPVCEGQVGLQHTTLHQIAILVHNINNVQQPKHSKTVRTFLEVVNSFVTFNFLAFFGLLTCLSSFQRSFPRIKRIPIQVHVFVYWSLSSLPLKYKRKRNN